MGQALPGPGLQLWMHRLRAWMRCHPRRVRPSRFRGLRTAYSHGRRCRRAAYTVSAPRLREEVVKKLTGLTQEARAHWAFQPVEKPALPAVQHTEWCCTDGDRFILARLEAAGLEPSTEAHPVAPGDAYKRTDHLHTAVSGLRRAWCAANLSRGTHGSPSIRTAQSSIAQGLRIKS